MRRDRNRCNSISPSAKTFFKDSSDVDVTMKDLQQSSIVNGKDDSEESSAVEDNEEAVVLNRFTRSLTR
jgi:hypothetical protein